MRKLSFLGFSRVSFVRERAVLLETSKLRLKAPREAKPSKDERKSVAHITNLMGSNENFRKLALMCSWKFKKVAKTNSQCWMKYSWTEIISPLWKSTQAADCITSQSWFNLSGGNISWPKRGEVIDEKPETKALCFSVRVKANLAVNWKQNRLRLEGFVAHSWWELKSCKCRKFSRWSSSSISAHVLVEAMATAIYHAELN